MNRKTSKMLKFFMPIPAFLAAFLPFVALADTFWTGAGETSDWNDSGNWYSSGGNYVFGGNQVSSLPDVDPIVVTFSTPVSVSGGQLMLAEGKTSCSNKEGRT